MSTGVGDADRRADPSPAVDPPRQRVRQRMSFRREERREFRHTLSVLIAVFLSWSFWLTPRPIRYAFADRCADLFHRSSTMYVADVRANVETVAAWSGETIDSGATVRSVFRTSARNFMDLITMPRSSDRAMVRAMTFRHGSWQSFDDLLADGKGIVLVTAHVGCFDFIGHAMVARGYRLTVVTGRTTSRFIFDGVTYLRGARGMKMVEPSPSGVRHVMKALRRNEIVVFLSDLDFFQNGLTVPLMGHDTTLPPGAVRIARETGAPLLPVFARRTETGHLLRIGEPFTVVRTRDQRADTAAGMVDLVAALEWGIASSLDQWVMFQRVWSDEGRVPVRVFPKGSPLESEFLERVAQVLPEREQFDPRLRRAARQQDDDGPRSGSIDPPTVPDDDEVTT